MKELVIVLGLSWSEKKKYIFNEFKEAQMIWPFSIKNAMEYTRIPKDSKNTFYLITEILARSLLISNFKTVVVDEHSLELESIFIWKKIAVEHGYEIRVLIVDVPIEDCFPARDQRTKQRVKNIIKSGRKLEQLKEILEMKYQNVIDKFEVVQPIIVEEKEDEVL